MHAKVRAMTIPFKAVRARWQSDPAYRAAYEAVSPELDASIARAQARLLRTDRTAFSRAHGAPAECDPGPSTGQRAAS